MNKIIILDIDIYPVSSIIGASYLFLDKIYINFDFIDNNRIKANIKVINENDEKNIDNIVGEYYNNVLHYALRESVGKINKKIRKYLVEKAIFSAVEENNSSDEVSIFDDPNGIAVPWEEKFNK